MADDNMEIVRALNYSPHRDKKNALDITRQKTAEAIAAVMPRILARLLELSDSNDEAVAARVCIALLNKQLPSPLAERPLPTEREIDGEVVTEDVREIRAKIEAEHLKQKGKD